MSSHKYHNKLKRYVYCATYIKPTFSYYPQRQVSIRKFKIIAVKTYAEKSRFDVNCTTSNIKCNIKGDKNYT